MGGCLALRLGGPMIPYSHSDTASRVIPAEGCRAEGCRWREVEDKGRKNKLRSVITWHLYYILPVSLRIHSTFPQLVSQERDLHRQRQGSVLWVGFNQQVHLEERNG